MTGTTPAPLTCADALGHASCAHDLGIRSDLHGTRVAGPLANALAGPGAQLLRLEEQPVGILRVTHESALAKLGEGDRVGLLLDVNKHLKDVRARHELGRS